MVKALMKILAIFMQNSRDSELKADGARKGELARRDEQEEIREDAKEHRKINNSNTDGDVLNRL